MRPLDFAPFPGGPARSLFAPDVVEAELDRLAAAQQADGGWRVDFDSYSPAATLEWRGHRTVNSLVLLRANGSDLTAAAHRVSACQPKVRHRSVAEPGGRAAPSRGARRKAGLRMDDATEHGSATGDDPGPVPRTFGHRAWVRSVALVGGGLVAGGILAGTLTANAAEDSTTTTDAPSVTHRRTAPRPTAPRRPRTARRGAGSRGDAGTAPDQSTTPDSTTPESGT